MDKLIRMVLVNSAIDHAKPVHCLKCCVGSVRANHLLQMELPASIFMLPIKLDVWARPLIRKPKPCLDVHRLKIDDKNAAVILLLQRWAAKILFFALADKMFFDGRQNKNFPTLWHN